MSNIILTTYFTSKKDPQRGKITPNNNFGKIKEWYTSIVNLGLYGVIIHDNLSDDFILRHENKNIRFEKVAIDGSRSLNDIRYMCYFEYLKKNPVDRVFMTDLFDVKFTKDPFSLVEKGKIYSGDEKGKIAASHPPVRAVYRSMKKNPPKGILLNAGVVGGEYNIVMSYLEKSVEIYKRLPKGGNYNMGVHNFVLYENFRDRLVSGSPMVSIFKRNERSGNFAIKHK